MNDQNKDTVKKNLTTGASTAAGAVAGAAAGVFFASNTAEAEPTPDDPIIPHIEPPTETSHVTNETHHHNHVHVNIHEPEPPIYEPVDDEPEPGDPEPVPGDPEPPIDEPIPGDPGFQFNGSGEVEVIDYSRVTAEDGSQMDVAVLNIDGNEVHVIDVNIDGYADLIAYDANNDGVLVDGEIRDVTGSGIEMEPLQAAVGYDPTINDPLLEANTSDSLAQNDMPDYVNDANVDSFMA